jgi:hypothetical protein
MATNTGKAKDIDLNTVNDLINFKLDSVKDEMKEEMTKQLQGLTNVLQSSSQELQGFQSDMVAGIERKIDDGVANALAAARGRSRLVHETYCTNRGRCYRCGSGRLFHLL